MTKKSPIPDFNPTILRLCREQMAFSLGDKEVRNISKKAKQIEEGTVSPTFLQLRRFAKLYCVPSWVFIVEGDELPKQFQYQETILAFRTFAGKEPSFNGNVRRWVKHIEDCRNLVLELSKEFKEPIANFSSPQCTIKDDPSEVAKSVRKWLGASHHLGADDWKRKLEEKNIFISMTNKYRGEGKFGDEFRGISIYHEVLPILIINDSDANKAQTFTLFHELGHLLIKRTAITNYTDDIEETWCNRFAGAFLMPEQEFKDEFKKCYESSNTINLKFVERIANPFKVSPSACLVRMRHLSLIEKFEYDDLYKKLQRRIQEKKKKLSESEGGPKRERPKEVVRQYGRLYIPLVLRAYEGRHIGLAKLCHLLGIKRASDALKVPEVL